MNTPKISKYKLSAINTLLKDYCSFSTDYDYMEVIKWKNREGFDVYIGTKHKKESFRMTWGEYKALTELLSELS